MSRPASSPRRWPDLLIGLLVALLLVGFGLLLLGPGGRPGADASPAGASAAESASTPPASAPSADTTTIPAAPDTAPAATTGATASAEATPEAADATAAAEPPTIAAAPVTAQPTAPVGPGSTAEEVAAATGTAPADAAGSAPTGTAPRSSGAVATSERRVPLRSDYRITLGTFSSESAAQSSTSGVSGLGYTVYPIDLGSQVVAQVGPFADEASARQALADIQRTYPRAILYPPRNRSLSGDSSTPAATSSSTTTEAATPAPAPSGPTYLQVGAFDRAESAQRLVGRLRDLGYAPSVNAPEGRKVTVVVGPFTGDALTRTESRLSSNGLDHFRVR